MHSLLTMSVALVGFASARVRTPLFASGANSTSGVLEVTKDMLHQCGFAWELVATASEVAREARARSNTALNFHRSTSSDNGILLTGHGVMEEEGIDCSHLLNRRSNRWKVGILLWNYTT